MYTFDFRQSRRGLLQMGSLGFGGLTLPDLLQAEAGGANIKPTAKSVIMLFQFGGPSQYETFDMKPDAPSGIRGEFNPIDSSVPGIQVCEYLPEMSKLAHKFAQVRSVHHDPAIILGLIIL